MFYLVLSAIKFGLIIVLLTTKVSVNEDDQL